MTFVLTTRRVLKVLEREQDPITASRIARRASDMSTEAAVDALVALERAGLAVKTEPSLDGGVWRAAR